MDVPEEELYKELKQQHDKKKRKEILTVELNPIIYVRNVPSTDFYLILQGTVMVCTGQEGFFLELGPFNYLGVDALLKEEYLPDFSAKIINKARLLRIKKSDYRLMVSNHKNVKRAQQQHTHK
jgi:CRP-like cAMP-binding protein